MKNKFHLLFFLLAFSLGSVSAQINGTAVAPVVSDAENPVYYYIESASDGSYSFNGFTGDFRGNVIISPAAVGFLIHKPLNEAPTVDHALWTLASHQGKTYLKNKATGFYMSAAHSVSVENTVNTFDFKVIAGNQYRINTIDAGTSYTVAYQNNTCDRLNVGIQANSLSAWYFVGLPTTAIDIAIVSAKNTLNFQTTAGIHPGQYGAEARNILQTAIGAAVAANADAAATEENKNLAAGTLNTALQTYLASKNSIQISDATSEYWYLIKGERGSTATALFAENQGGNAQVLNKERALSDAQLWKVVANGAGVAIQSKLNASYINADAGASPVKVGTKNTKPTVAFKTSVSTHKTDAVDKIDYFLVENTGASVTFRLHAAEKSNDFGLLNYTGDAADNCSFQFLSYDPSDVLSGVIAAAETVYAKSPSGVNPGAYTIASKNTFKAAIDAASAVLNSGADSDEKGIAASTLAQAQTAFLASRNEIKLSTEGNETWYYIASANTTYATGEVIVNQNNTAGTSILFTAKSLDPNKLWKFTDAGNGKVSIQNRASKLYISANPKTSGSSATAVPFTATFLGSDAQFTFNANGQNPIHAQRDGSLLVVWAGGLNSASAWKLEQLSAADNNSEVIISGSSMKQRYTETGIGNKDFTLAYATLSTSGLAGEALIKSFTLDFNGTTNINAIENIRIYATGAATKVDKTKHTLVAILSQVSSATQSTVVNFTEPFNPGLGSTNFHVVADISENANEGDKLNVRLLSVAYSNNGDKTFTPTTKATPFASTVFLKQSIVFTPGDLGSVSYRIPAIVTAADGSLVTLTDKRKYNAGDLPGDIDILARRSTDGGKTWGQPVTVAFGTGGGKGFGDPVLLKANSGKLITLFVGGPGLWSSTPTNPIRSYVSTSSDNGLTWTTPRDVTDQLFGAGSLDPIRSKWKASFFGSGQGLCTRSGRVMAVAAVSEPDMGGLQNYVFYSDDEGENWNVSKRAIQGGDEAKVVELNNGDILMSSRAGGNRLWAKSKDGGVTWGAKNSWSQIWGNACNADILRYTSTLDGYSKDRLLHTLPNANDRRNVSMWISYDEGTTWPTKKTICPGTSAYSSFTILPDGTIGVYLEVDGDTPYTMMYVNFSLDWLTNGKDFYEAPTAVNTIKKNDLEVYSENGYIKTNKEVTAIRIFNLQGAELNNNSPLNNGIYLVTIDKNTYKVHVD